GSGKPELPPVPPEAPMPVPPVPPLVLAPAAPPVLAPAAPPVLAPVPPLPAESAPEGVPSELVAHEVDSANEHQNPKIASRVMGRTRTITRGARLSRALVGFPALAR